METLPLSIPAGVYFMALHISNDGPPRTLCHEVVVSCDGSAVSMKTPWTATWVDAMATHNRLHTTAIAAINAAIALHTLEAAKYN